MGSKKFQSGGDVRMRGFAGRVRVEEAWEWLDGRAVLGEKEKVGLEQSHGRVLAEEVRLGGTGLAQYCPGKS